MALQAEKEGGLPEVVRQSVIAIARDVPLRVRIAESLSKRPREIPADQALTSTVVQTRDARLRMRGSLIVKKYKERTLVVKVLDDGFHMRARGV